MKDRASVVMLLRRARARARLCGVLVSSMPVLYMRSAFCVLGLVPILCNACSSDSHPAVIAPPPTVQITADNAVDVARVAISASLGLADVAGIGTGVITTVPPSPLAPLSLPSFVRSSLAELTMTGSALAARMTVTIPGADGGEAVRTWDDLDDNGKVSTGDLFTITFVAFAEEGLVINGTLQFVDLFVQGDLVDGLSWIVRTRLDFLNLAVAAGSATETLNGSLRCVREQRATVQTLDMEVVDGFTVVDMELAAGTKLAYHEYTLEPTFAQFAEGAVASESIGGRIDMATLVPFTGFQFLPDPSVGQLEVHGAGGSMLTITAVDFFNVEIGVDADGDGEVELTIALEWADL